jgi:hypothetical protein
MSGTYSWRRKSKHCFLQKNLELSLSVPQQFSGRENPPSYVFLADNNFHYEATSENSGTAVEEDLSLQSVTEKPVLENTFGL